MTHTSHWCHDVSTPGPVDPDGCCADQPTAFRCPWPEHAHQGWGETSNCDPDPTRCSVCNPEPDQPTATSIAANLRATADHDAADRLARGLGGVGE